MMLDMEGKPCVRCGRPLRRGDAVDLDHRDDGRGYLGLAHAHCNRSAGATRGNQLRSPRRKLSMKSVSLAVAVSIDRSHTAIAAAGTIDGRNVFELVDWIAGSDTAGLVAEIASQRAIKDG